MLVLVLILGFLAAPAAAQSAPDGLELAIREQQVTTAAEANSNAIITALQNQIMQLKAQIARLQAPPPTPEPAKPSEPPK
jgi:hypothetical protein